MGGGVLFCSRKFDNEALSKEISSQLSDFPLIGCSSAGELTPRGYDNDSLVFVGFPEDSFAMSVLTFSDLDHFDRDEARNSIRHLAANARKDAASLGSELHQVALFLVDGLSHREEVLTITVQDALGDTPLVGGSSGDGLMFRETEILAGSQFQRGAAVIAILTSSRPLHAFSANHYQPGPERMVVTEADSEKRIVYEINAAPAAEEYLRLAGGPSAVLDTAFFAAHPPMVRTGGTYHVRSIQTANADGSLTFYCAIDTGIVLTIGEPVDRLRQLSDMFDDIEEEIGAIDCVLGFDCVLNRVDAESRQLTRQVSELYARRRVMGFNTYGEQFRAAHVNQTFSGLAIGS